MIVDASNKAITTGQTDAYALRRAVESGAEVFSNPDLHAKVYVLWPRLFVGSANASLNSREELIECLACSSEPRAVGQALSFISSLKAVSDVVDEKFLQRIEALPVGPRSRPSKRKTPPLAATDSKCWLLGMTKLDYPGDVDAVEEANEQLQRQLGEHTGVDWFWWSPSKQRFFREAKVGDRFIEVWRPKPGRRTAHGVAVTPESVIHAIHTDPDGRKVFHFVSGETADDRAISWKSFLKLLAEANWDVCPSIQGSRLVPEPHAITIARLWPE